MEPHELESPPRHGVAAGDVIADKYRVVRVRGEGAMGVVVAAKHLELDELVAIKMLQPDLVSDDVARERFAREARASARLKSDHVARVVDVGALATGIPSMVMEYLDGEDLGGFIRRGGLIRPSQAAVWVSEACDALDEARSAQADG